ncbi:MAG: histidine kinase [Candidatus Acidiferrum sp.]|jgi:Ca2+/Na+ antiporter
MHPLLARPGRFPAYAVAWVPVTIFVTYLLRASGKLSWTEALVLALPLCLVYLFICLSAWYSCKSAPLDRTDPIRLVLTHIAAAAVESFLWVELGRLIPYALSRFSAFSDLSSRYAAALPVLFAAGILIYLLAIAYYYVILSLDASREAQARIMETTILARDAELKALKAQVNPHFLFNSLNSINALTSIDPAKAREMCILLAEFLRMTLGLGEKSSIPLGEELHLLERFLAIEKVRFGARLEMREDIQAQAKTAQIPALILQPLVENAVTHGIANLLDGGIITLTARSTADRLTIIVENTCDLDATSIRRGGLGLANVRSRLDARYGKEADMRVTAESGTFKVQLSLPIEIAPAEVRPEALEAEEKIR